MNNVNFYRPYLIQKQSNLSHSSSFFSTNRSIKYLYPTAQGGVQSTYLKSIGYGYSDQTVIKTTQAVKEQIDQLECLLPKEGRWNIILHAYDKLIQEIPRPEKYTNRDLYIKEKIKFRNKLTEKLQKLKIDEVLLLPATLQDNVNIFYILNRDNQGYSFKIIGCNEWMLELSEVPSKKHQEKDKILSKICFVGIPEACFSKEVLISLFCDPLLENYFSTENVKSQLSLFPSTCRLDVSNLEEAWVVKSPSSWKSLGLVIQELRNKGKDFESKTLIKRLEFQAKLLDLFKLYKQVRYDLEKDSKSEINLKKLVQAIAKETYLLGCKGILSEEDLAAIDRELDFIQQNCKKAAVQVLSSIDTVGKLPSLIIPFASNVCKPVKLAQIKALSVKGRSNAAEIPLNLSFNKISGSLLSNAEVELLQLSNFLVVLTFFKAIKDKMNLFAQQEEKEILCALYIELFQKFPVDDTKDALWMKLTPTQVLEVQECFLELTRLFVSHRIENFPMPTQCLVVLKVGLFISNLRLAYTDRKYGITVSDHPLMSLENTVGAIFEKGGHVEKGAYLERPFFVMDEPGLKVLDELKKIVNRYTNAKKIFSENENKLSKASAEEMSKVLSQFFNTSKFFYSDLAEKSFNTKIYSPNKLEKYAKPFHHPLFPSVLSQMSITGKVMDVVYKLYHEGKLSNYHISFSEKPKIEGAGWNKSEEEREEMQKDFDRTESMKLPEAITDDPQRVIDTQIEVFLEWMKLNGVEKPTSFKKNMPHPYKKEELVDLLYLLRKKSPQVEAIAFLKTYPHLLSNSDVRNFIEYIIFDVRGSSWSDMSFYNFNFVYDLPNYLKEEIKHYLLLATKDPSYYDHLLFHLLLLRKMKMTSSSKQDYDSILNLIYEKNRHHEKILMDPTLHAYHFRAAFEYLMFKVNKGNLQSAELIELIRIFHKLQTLPRDIHDVDPNEMATLNRLYAVYVQSLKEKEVLALSDLLNTLCNDQGLLIDASPWQGKFPRYSNASYEINVLKGQITSRLFNGILVSLPMQINAHPAFESILAGVDQETMRVHLFKQNHITIYMVTDKQGLRGRIEEEKEGYRFYKTFHSEKKELQVFSLKEYPGMMPVYPLSGNAFYIDPESPQEGLCFDDKDKLQFKIQFTYYKGSADIKSVVDCRQGKESKPYQIHSFSSLKHAGLKNLALFENPSDILVYSQEGKIKKIEFQRYGLAFSIKGNKLRCMEPKFKGYFINLSALLEDKKGVPYSLLMHHDDEEMPNKLLLPDASVIKAEPSQLENQNSSLSQWWSLASSYLNYSAPSPVEQMPDLLANYKPKHTQDKYLKYHVITIRPCTEELLPEDRVRGSMALLSQAILHQKYLLAIKALLHIKLQLSDLSKDNVKLFMEFLQHRSLNDGHEASIKIQLIFMLKNLIEDKAQFFLIKEKLNTFLFQHAKIYITQSKKLDQRLLLNKALFDQMAMLIKDKHPEYFQNHLQSFFGNVNLKTQLMETKKNGGFGIDQIPLEELENQIKKMEALSKPSPKLSLLKEGVPILYKDEDLISFFTQTTLYLPPVKLALADSKLLSCEMIAILKLEKEMESYRAKVQQEKRYIIKSTDELKKKIDEQRKESAKLSAQKRKVVESLLYESKNPLQSLALKGGMQAVVSFQELSIAFLQKELNTLKSKGLISEELDVVELEKALKEFFEAEVIKLMLRDASSILAKLQDSALLEAEKWNQSTLLFQLLTTRRFYSTKDNPELLVYECFAQKIFRHIGGGVTQIHLLRNMLENHNGIFQAKTGTGKTTVVSILWGLIKATGNNLVVFKVLPTLLEQSKSIFQEQLGISFERKIYNLQFNLKINSIIREKRENGVVEHSLFKQIYHQLLVTMKAKGCVLTDYKSFPLMQEKWIKLNREFIAWRKIGSAIPDIEKEHWTYLKKIIKLLKHNDECLMDEFDLPNRSCNRLQIPLGQSIELPDYFYEKSLELYEFIKDDNRLELALDKQRDLFELYGRAVLLDLAKHLASKLSEGKKELYKAALLKYLLGEDEEILGMFMFNKESSSYKDILAFYKDQICIFLPLTLTKANGLGYKRSEDGFRTIPCPEGEPQENSRHGHPIEEINYIIQDYIQIGVSLPDFKKWLMGLQEDVKKNRGSTTTWKQYQEIFPGESFPTEILTEQELIKKCEQINQTWKSVKYFLTLRLKTLEVSGEVISMNPHDSASMSKRVTGISATFGCVDELSRQLKNTKDNEGIIGEMAYRLFERTAENPTPIEFIPDQPYEIFKKGIYHALIDGGAFYRRVDSKEVAEKFLTSHPHLAKVGYYNEKQETEFVGKVDATLAQKGFFFSKNKSRGADIALQYDATALLTVDNFKTIEDLLQNHGRMRQKGQKIQLVRSLYSPGVANTVSLLIHCARNGGKARSPGLYNSKMLEISHLVKEKAFVELLDIEDFEQSLDRFESWLSLFIQKSAHDYRVSGSYFEANKHQRKINFRPSVSLAVKKERWLKKAEELNLQVNELENLTWSDEVLGQMPEWVAGPDDVIDTGLEVEEEVEHEHEVEAEMNVEMEREEENEFQFDQCGEIPFYPTWKIQPKEYSIAKVFHPAFDSRLYFLENFLPIERKDSLYKRYPFDKAMPRIRMLHMTFQNLPKKIEKVVIGDILDDVTHRPKYSNSYDLCTSKWVSCKVYDTSTHDLTEDFQAIRAQVKFLNGEYEDYTDLEWNSLKKWLTSLRNPEEMRDYFAKVILKHKPRKAEAFKLSPLFRLFETYTTSN